MAKVNNRAESTLGPVIEVAIRWRIVTISSTGRSGSTAQTACRNACATAVGSALVRTMMFNLRNLPPPVAILVFFVLGLSFWVGYTIATIQVEPFEDAEGEAPPTTSAATSHEGQAANETSDTTH